MEKIDKYISELKAINVQETASPDFDNFWCNNLKSATEMPLNISGGKIKYPDDSVDVHDLTFDGLDGTPIKTWLLLPEVARTKKVPVVISYHGVGGSRFSPSCFAHWTSLGVAVIAMDFRMQGGLTGSKTGFTSSGNIGIYCLGLLDKNSYYFFHTITDALRAIKLARQTEQIDNNKIAVEGSSQGGGVALVLAAIDSSVALCMADVPSSCWWENRVYNNAGAGFNIANFIREHPEKLDQVMNTLSYFDNINHAKNIKNPVLVSCGLEDKVCPPECIYAAYNKIKSKKEIINYPFAGHEGGRFLHTEKKLEFIKKEFKI